MVRSMHAIISIYQKNSNTKKLLLDLMTFWNFPDISKIFYCKRMLRQDLIRNTKLYLPVAGN